MLRWNRGGLTVGNMGRVHLNMRFPILSHTIRSVNDSHSLQPCQFEICFPDHGPMLLSISITPCHIDCVERLEKDGDHRTMAMGRSSAACCSCGGVSNRDGAAPSSRNTNSQYLSVIISFRAEPKSTEINGVFTLATMSFGFSFPR